MKKLFSTLLAVLGFSFLMAQSTIVPSNVQVAFKNQYKSTSVTWTASTQNYIAKWVSNEKKMTAFYTKEDPSTLVRTETDVPLTELSTGTQTAVNERFIGNGSPYTFNRSFKIEGFANVTEGVEFTMKNGDKTVNMAVYFDATGTMVKREVY